MRPAASALVKQNDVSLPGDRNQQRIDLLDLGRLDAGAYYLEVSGPNKAYRPPAYGRQPIRADDQAQR